MCIYNSSSIDPAVLAGLSHIHKETETKGQVPLDLYANGFGLFITVNTLEFLFFIPKDKCI